MKTAKAGLRTFSVWAKATIDCSITIEATSLENAVEKSKQLEDSDFFSVEGSYNDGTCKVYGVMEENL